MRNKNFDEARNQLKLIRGSTQIAEMIGEWSEVCTKNLFKKIGKETDYVTQEFADTFLQFGAFFQHLFILKLSEKLRQDMYKDVSEGVIKIFSNTFVKVFYKGTGDSALVAINAYANEINSFIHNSIIWYTKQVMSPENEERNRFEISASLLSYNISQKLRQQDYKQLVKDVLSIIMKVINTKKIDESIATLTN